MLIIQSSINSRTEFLNLFSIILILEEGLISCFFTLFSYFSQIWYQSYVLRSFLEWLRSMWRFFKRIFADYIVYIVFTFATNKTTVNTSVTWPEIIQKTVNTSVVWPKIIQNTVNTSFTWSEIIQKTNQKKIKVSLFWFKKQ